MKGTPEYNAWRRLKHVPDLYRVFQDMLPHFLSDPALPPGKPGRKGIALRMLRERFVKDLFVELLVQEVENGRVTVVAYCPQLNVCFERPEEPGNEMVEGHLATELREAVQPPDVWMEFPDALSTNLACQLFPDAGDDTDYYIQFLEERVKQLGFGLEHYMDFEAGLPVIFGDTVFPDYSTYLECKNLREVVLSFSRLAALLPAR